MQSSIFHYKCYFISCSKSGKTPFILSLLVFFELNFFLTNSYSFILGLLLLRRSWCSRNSFRHIRFLAFYSMPIQPRSSRRCDFCCWILIFRTGWSIIIFFFLLPIAIYLFVIDESNFEEPNWHWRLGTWKGILP